MGNSWTVEIKDFQSLSRVTIEIVNGINIITGRTNQGKSAVIRAIDAALFNLGDDSMVRGGKRYSGVSIDNGEHKMLFCRDSHGKNEKTAYQFDDGKVQKKVGRSQLSEVAQMFNIRDVRMQNGTKMKLNFWYQNDKPFLMDKTSGQLYEFLSLSSCDKYTRVLKKMIVDMKVQEADINNITTEIDTLKMVNNKKVNFINKNEGYDDLYVRIITADQKRRSLGDIESSIRRIRDISDKISKSRYRLKMISERFERIPMTVLTNTYENICRIYSVCSEYSKDIDRAKSLEEKIRESISEYRKLSDEYNLSFNSEMVFEHRLGVLEGEYVYASDISSVIRNGKRLHEGIWRRKTRLESLNTKMSFDDESCRKILTNLENGKLLVDNITYLLGKLDDIDNILHTKITYLKDVVSKLGENESELDVLKESAGYCPFCGTVFESK